MESLTRHASAVALDGSGVLILGSSGTGKSDLALQMMALGWGLIADDQVELSVRDQMLFADAPSGLPSLIEARGIGLLHTPLVGPTALALAIDLDQKEPARLPPLRHFTALGCSVPLIYQPAGINLAAALNHMIRHGRSEP